MLKWKAREARVVGARHQHTDERVHITKRVKLNQRERAVYQGNEKRRHAEMSAVIEQRQEARIEPAQRPDCQHDVQEQRRAGATRKNDQRFYGRVRVDQKPTGDEHGEVPDNADQNCGVVAALLTIPPDGAIEGAHDYQDARARSAAMTSHGSNTASNMTTTR